MEQHIRTASFLAKLLDNKFQIFGFRFGLNVLLELIPELGDVLAAGLSFYLVWIAIQMKLPKEKIIQMIWNITINFILGIIPVIGELTYLFRKANLKNLKILQDHMINHGVIEGETE